MAGNDVTFVVKIVYIHEIRDPRVLTDRIRKNRDGVLKLVIETEKTIHARIYTGLKLSSLNLIAQIRSARIIFIVLSSSYIKRAWWLRIVL